MGTKNDPGQFDCYENAEPDEPMFVLLARDKHAPAIIWLWATLRELDNEDPAKVKEARDCMAAMLAWAKGHDRPAVGVGQAALAAVMELIRAANAAAVVTPNDATDERVMRAYLTQTIFEA